MKITSVNNQIVKDTAKLLQKKYRKDTGLFLIEGEKGVKDAINNKIEICCIFIKKRGNIFPENIEIIETTENVLSKISDAKTPPQIIAVAKQQNYNLSDLSDARKIILLEGIKDAGNLGTILRSAVAFNIDAVILYGDTIDLYNPKTVRATVGNLWKIPIINLDNISTLKDNFKDFEFIATLPKCDYSTPLNNFKPMKKSIIMFGSEADGLTNELKSIANKNITIEMSEKVESLNLGISAGIIMYKLMQQ